MSEEPSSIWRVSCSCGYSERFRHKEDAKRVYDAHSSLDNQDLRCGGSMIEEKHAYPKGGVKVANTLPDKGKHTELESIKSDE